MDGATAGSIGGLVGGGLGLMGGVIGTYASYRHASGQRERRFVLVAAASLTAAIAGFLAALFFTPMPYRPFLWVPYAFLLPLGIYALNRRQLAMQWEKTTTPADPAGGGRVR